MDAGRSPRGLRSLHESPPVEMDEDEAFRLIRNWAGRTELLAECTPCSHGFTWSHSPIIGSCCGRGLPPGLSAGVILRLPPSLGQRCAGWRACARQSRSETPFKRLLDSIASNFAVYLGIAWQSLHPRQRRHLTLVAPASRARPPMMARQRRRHRQSESWSSRRLPVAILHCQQLRLQRRRQSRQATIGRASVSNSLDAKGLALQQMDLARFSFPRSRVALLLADHSAAS